MKLSDYILRLQQIAKIHGGDLPLVYSKDDEGNAFSAVVYAPSTGTLKGREFASSEVVVNAVCIN